MRNEVDYQSYLQRVTASSNANLKLVSDPVASTLAVEGEPEVLPLATSHVPNSFSSTRASNTAAFQFISNVLIPDF